jgi:MFS family permease
METLRTYKMGFLWRLSLVAAMGGLLFGYDWVVIGGAKKFYEASFGLIGPGNTWLSGWAMSSALAGCLLGAILSGLLSDKYGRKRLLIFAAFMFTASAIWTALAGDFNQFIAARIIGGVGIGLASALSPMYIAEISPGPLRGRMVSINQLTIVLGILAAQIVNWVIFNIDPITIEKGLSKLAETDIAAATEMTRLLTENWNGQNGWRWMFAAETIPAAIFFFMAMSIPESPRWLAKQSRLDEAKDILARVGGDDYAAQEVVSIEKTLQGEHNAVHFRELLNPKLMAIVGLGVFIAVFQQWCGINVIFNYAQDIFKDAGYSVGEAMFTIVITGAVNLVFTVAAMAVVDKIGRRKLMVFGAAGLMVIYAILGTCFFYGVTGWPMLVLVLAAIACYSMTLAPVTWVLLSELFPNRIRGAAMSISVFALWVACLVLTLTFPPLKKAMGADGTFWLYGGICLIGFVVMYLKVPETKGRSLEQIEHELHTENH